MSIINSFLQFESETVSETSIKIPFNFSNTDSVPKGKDVGDSIVISPITVRTWFKLKPLILLITKNDFDRLIESENRTPDADLIDIISKYDNLLIEIMCIGIHNKKSNPPEWFKEVLKDNCTWEDIYVIINAIFFRIGYNPFCKSITMLKNVSPLTEAEIIAAQNNLESWTNPLAQ